MIGNLNDNLKEQSIDNMTKNMTVLRTMLRLSQAELAALVGLGRQSLVAIETGKRKMTWNTFLSLLFVFSQNKETNSMLEIFGIYTEDLKKIYSGINT